MAWYQPLNTVMVIFFILNPSVLHCLIRRVIAGAVNKEVIRGAVIYLLWRPCNVFLIRRAVMMHFPIYCFSGQLSHLSEKQCNELLEIFPFEPVDEIVNKSQTELLYLRRLSSLWWKHNSVSPLNISTLKTVRYKEIKAPLCSVCPALCLTLGRPRVFDDKPLSNSTLLRVLDITNTHREPKTRLRSKNADPPREIEEYRTRQQTHL